MEQKREQREYYAYNRQMMHFKEQMRALKTPVLCRAQIMRSGIVNRSKDFGVRADLNLLTVAFITDWLLRQPACECCGRLFDCGRKYNGEPSDDSPSIDRIIPAFGYTAGNIALICWRCNNLKRDANASELLTVARWLYQKEAERAAQQFRDPFAYARQR